MGGAQLQRSGSKGREGNAGGTIAHSHTLSISISLRVPDSSEVDVPTVLVFKLRSCCAFDNAFACSSSCKMGADICVDTVPSSDKNESCVVSPVIKGKAESERAKDSLAVEVLELETYTAEGAVRARVGTSPSTCTESGAAIVDNCGPQCCKHSIHDKCLGREGDKKEFILRSNSPWGHCHIYTEPDMIVHSGWGGGGGGAFTWGHTQVKERSTPARHGMHMQQCSVVPISCSYHTACVWAQLFFAWPYFVSHNLWLAFYLYCIPLTGPQVLAQRLALNQLDLLVTVRVGRG